MWKSSSGPHPQTEHQLSDTPRLEPEDDHEKLSDFIHYVITMQWFAVLNYHKKCLFS